MYVCKGFNGVANFVAEMTQKPESNIRNLEKLETKVKEVSENNFILVHAVDDIERGSIQNL